jgi:thioredoxin 1
MSNLTSVNENNFETEVLKSEIPVLVDFWASWCSYCIKMNPTLEELAEEHAGKLKIVKLNVDENKSLPQKYNIMSLPTMMLFKGGEPAETLVGFSPKVIVNAKLSSHL